MSQIQIGLAALVGEPSGFPHFFLVKPTNPSIYQNSVHLAYLDALFSRIFPYFP